MPSDRTAPSGGTVVVPRPVRPVSAPGGAAEARAGGRTPGGRCCSAARPAGQTGAWRGHTLGPWTRQRSPLRPTSQGTLAGASVQPRSRWWGRPFRFCPQACGCLGRSHAGPLHPGLLLSLWDGPQSRPSSNTATCQSPRHTRRGKTNGPGILHRLAWPRVGLSV